MTLLLKPHPPPFVPHFLLTKGLKTGGSSCVEDLIFAVMSESHKSQYAPRLEIFVRTPDLMLQVCIVKIHHG